MTHRRNYDQPASYIIRIQGAIDSSWSDWFGGFTITTHGEETQLVGVIPDQSALQASSPRPTIYACQSYLWKSLIHDHKEFNDLPNFAFSYNVDDHPIHDADWLYRDVSRLPDRKA